MLGMERDTFLIDIRTSSVYNLGGEAGIDDAEKQMQSICGPKDVRYKSNRFIVISGIEWGIDSYNPKTRVNKSTYNPNVIKKGKYFSSQY